MSWMGTGSWEGLGKKEGRWGGRDGTRTGIRKWRVDIVCEI